MDGGSFNIHALLPRSRVNGPGQRIVVFFQGCQRRCPGCFNPATHPMEAGEKAAAAGVLGAVDAGGAEGLTVSGGEPFLQPAGLLALLREARSRGLSTVVYTGFTLEQLRSDGPTRACLDHIDVLIDGPFMEQMPETTLLARGSTNQRLHFLTSRYRPQDFLMPGRAEVTIGPDGTVMETGFSRIAIEAAQQG